MSLNHPSIAHRIREIDRLAVLAEAGEGQRAAEVRRPMEGRPALAATMRRRLGSATVCIGRRLQGAEPVGHAAIVTARSGAAP